MLRGILSGAGQKYSHSLDRSLADFRTLAEPPEPLDAGLSAKPGDLALGVAPGVALRIEQGLAGIQFAADRLQRLLVAQRFEGLDGREAHRQDAARLVDQAALEHGAAARVEPLVQGLAVGQQPEFERAVAAQPVAALPIQFGHRAAGKEANLERAGDLRNVVRVNLTGGLGIESGKGAVERSAPARLARGETVAQRLVAGRPFEEAVQERTEVEARAARDNREPAARRNACDGFPRQPGVFARGEDLVGVDDVDQMVRDALARGLWKFGGADIEMTVYLEGVAAHDFAAERFGESDAQAAFPRACRAGHRNQGQFRRVWHYRLRIGRMARWQMLHRGLVIQ